MAKRTVNTEQILPCLLDRLTDNYPRATRESREHRVISVSKYRDSVLRDLCWLLNSSSHPSEEDLEGFDVAKRSVLNYGLESLSGIWNSTRDVSRIETQIREAILNFEPRILPETLSVSLISQDDDKEHKNSVMILEISGELYTKPILEQLYIKTEVDLETGACQVSGG